MNDLTQQAVVALKSGNKIRARNLLKAALRQDPRDTDAWLWLSGAVESDNERVDCLQNVLRLDPTNRAAAKGYAQLTGREWAAPAQPETLIPPAMVPMGEGAPPAALDQLAPAAEEPPAALEGEVAAQAAVDEVLMQVQEPAAQAEEPAPEAAAPLPEETPAFPEPEPAAMEEEPRIKSWEELLGPSETEEAPAAEDIYAAAARETSDTQEVRTGRLPADLKFVTGPSLGYGFFKLLLALVVFAALVGAGWYLLPGIPRPYVVIAAVILAVFWVILLLVTVLGSSANRYSLAKDRLFIESGLFGRKQVGLALADVEDLQTRRTLLQKMGGVGDILLKTREDGQFFRLSNIPRFKQRLQELKDAMA